MLIQSCRQCRRRSAGPDRAPRQAGTSWRDTFQIIDEFGEIYSFRYRNRKEVTGIIR